MYQMIRRPQNDLTIECQECVDRGGNYYEHPFIGKYAVSQKMMNALAEYGIRCLDGDTIPSDFYSHHKLFTVSPDDNNCTERYVTSQYWITCS